jgi:hypothetical protein
MIIEKHGGFVPRASHADWTHGGGRELANKP